MASLHPCELWPEALARVQLWSIGWQTFSVDPFRRAVRQELVNEVTAVNRGAIPDDHHAARYFAQQMRQEGDPILCIERVLLTVAIPRAVRGYGADGREVITGPPLLQDRRLTYRRISTHHTGSRVEA